MDIRPQAESALNACGSRSGESGIPHFILVLWSLMKYILLREKEITGWHQKKLRIRKKG